MARGLSQRVLAAENTRFRDTAGVSRNAAGFLPAFLDTADGRVYLSRFADGRPAPCHLLDGLPAHVVTARSADGRVHKVRPSLCSGFVRAGRFYTREQAATLAA